MIETIRLRYTIASLVMFVVGILALWWSTTVKEAPQQVILEQLGAAALISGIWTAVQEFLIRKDIAHQNQNLLDSIAVQHKAEIDESRKLLDNVESLHRFEREAKEIGLTQVLDDSTRYPYHRMIEDGKDHTDLVFAVNDGRTWLSTNINSFEIRFRNPQTKTRFILVHPQSEYTNDLAKKVGITQAAQQNKILEACQMLIDAYERLPENSRGGLEIYGHYLVSVLAVYKSESLVLVEPYYFTPGRNKPPLFAISPRTDGSYYSRIQSDLEDLIHENASLLYRNGEKFDELARLEIN